MEKFIPYEKLSKKEKRRRDAMRRGTWGALDPVTRKGPNPRAYNRKKTRKWMEDPYSVSFYVVEKVNGFFDNMKSPLGELEGAAPASNQIRCRAKPCFARRTLRRANIFAPLRGAKITALFRPSKSLWLSDSLKSPPAVPGDFDCRAVWRNGPQ